MIWIVPCVAGCDGPMLTMTASSRAFEKAGRTGLGSSMSTPLAPVWHERLLALLRVVLAQRVPRKALVEEHRPQIGIAAEDDAVHVVALALHEACRAVERGERVDS